LQGISFYFKQRAKRTATPMASRPRTAHILEIRRDPMYLILAVVLVVLWLGGFFVMHVSSFFIHLLLLFAVISIVMHFVSGSRSTV